MFEPMKIDTLNIERVINHRRTIFEEYSDESECLIKILEEIPKIQLYLGIVNLKVETDINSWVEAIREIAHKVAFPIDVLLLKEEK